MEYLDRGEYPNYRIVPITVTFDDPSTPAENDSVEVGSGIMVGRNDILTAAHVVYSPTLETVDIDIDYSRPNDPVTGLTVIGEGFNGVNIANLEEGEAINWRVNSWAAPVEDGQLSKAGSEWDLALIGVSDPIGDTTGWANILPNQGSGTYTAAGFASLQLTADTGHVNFSPPL